MNGMYESFAMRANISSFTYTVSQKNDTDVAHYNFNAHQPISLIFGTDIAE